MDDRWLPSIRPTHPVFVNFEFFVVEKRVGE
jgi:hypothetical protein